MNARDTAVLAMRTMRASKLRTALTALGITIGIAAVILLVGLGNGMQDSLDRNGSRTATVITVSRALGLAPGAALSRRLTDNDAVALAEAPAIDKVVPKFTGASVIRIGANTTKVTVLGVTPDYLAVQSEELAYGSTFDEADARTGARVVVIGQGVVNYLFGGNPNNAIGQQVTLGRLPFRVIGTLKASSLADQQAFMPLRTARTILLGGINRLTAIGVTATSVQDVPAAQRQINEILDREHLVRDKGLRDYTQEALLVKVQKTQEYLDLLKVFIIAIAGIALLVGAVGIANIQLISVQERRTEIGIRRAVGATRGAIVRQMLAESTVIAGVGGITGVLLGVGATLIAADVLPSQLPGFGVASVSVAAVVIAFAVSLGIGVVAGVAPAWRAARLQPVDALRG
jgi:putative ABC transport system permease protein